MEGARAVVRDTAVPVVVQVAAVIVLIGASLAVLCSLFYVPLLALPALLLAWGSVGLYRLRRWGGVLVCAVCWCAVAFLLLSSAMWGLSDTSYPTAFDDPSFAVVFWSGL